MLCTSVLDLFYLDKTDLSHTSHILIKQVPVSVLALSYLDKTALCISYIVIIG